MIGSKAVTKQSETYVPLLVLSDVFVLCVTWYFSLVVLKMSPTPQSFHTFMPLRVIPVFLALVCFRSYSTIWARAFLSNYVRLILSVGCGVLGSMALMMLLGYKEGRVLAFPVIHFGLALLLLVAIARRVSSCANSSV